MKSGVEVGRKWGKYLARNELRILEAINYDPHITINGLSEKIGIVTTKPFQ